jgi:hypothetical protein
MLSNWVVKCIATSTLSLFVSFGLAIVFAASPMTAQTQANCNFKTFDPPSGYIYGFSPNGINHYNTVVGEADGPQQGMGKAFIRYSGGGMSLFSVPKAQYTAFNRRNLYGTTVGWYGTQPVTVPPGTGSNGLIYTSKSYATLNYPGSASTELNGINKWNTIVGTALGTGEAGGTKAMFGFQYENGKFTPIKYPGATQTILTGINDNSVIVGGYQKGNSQWTGFVLENGTFKNVKLSPGYVPSDISNEGEIVSGNEILYPNGKLEIISLPGSAGTNALGINDLGVISGEASYGTFEFTGFTATCK